MVCCIPLGPEALFQYVTFWFVIIHSTILSTTSTKTLVFRFFTVEIISRPKNRDSIIFLSNSGVKLENV